MFEAWWHRGHAGAVAAAEPRQRCASITLSIVTPPRSRRIYRHIFDRAPVTKIKMYLSPQKCCSHICGYLEKTTKKKKKEKRMETPLNSCCRGSTNGFSKSCLKACDFYLFLYLCLLFWLPCGTNYSVSSKDMYSLGQERLIWLLCE